MFNKQQVKSFVLGTVVTSALFSAAFTESFAESIEKKITVLYNNIKIVVDGQPIRPTDANGNPVEPFIYNGTTYLPVRAVAQAVGKEVNWDGETNTVYLGQVREKKSAKKLIDIECFNAQGSSSSWYDMWDRYEDKDNTGTLYEHGLKFNIGNYLGEEWIYNDYLLNGKYKRLTGRFVLAHESKNSNTNAVLEIYGDDKLLYKSPSMTGGKLPVDIDIDISGVTILKIKVIQDERFLGRNLTTHSYGFVDVNLYE